MASTLTVIIGILTFDVLILIVFGMIGGEIAIAETGFNGTVDVDQINISSGQDLSLAETPSFLKSVGVTINGLPWWMDTFLALKIGRAHV